MGSRWQRAVTRGLSRVQPFVRVAERVAPLTRLSHPAAVAGVLVSCVSDLLGGGTPAKSPPVCLAGDRSAIDAICRAASEAGVGTIVSEPQPGWFVREHDGCEWGIADCWRHGPYGSPTVLPRAVWEALGPALAIASAPHSERVELRSDRLSAACALPSSRALAIAAEARALLAAGEPVGVLLHGPPGTGKSVIARAIAAELGGYSLRASLGGVPWPVLETLVHHMAPKAVIVDDIDRGSTSHALDLAEVLTSAGVAMIATVNDSSAVDRALLRARRLGLHYEVAGIDPGVLEAVLAGLEVEPAARALLERSTVAVARDFAGHQRALGAERALQLLRERMGTTA